MTNYTATFHTDIAFATATIDADSPKHALRLARHRAASDPSMLQWQSYIPGHELPHKIEITDPDGNDRAVWENEELTLRLAAPTLLSALRLAVEALNIAPRFKVEHLNTDSYRIASICSAAIKEAAG